MRSAEPFLYMQADRVYFESIDHYQPDEHHFVSYVRERLRHGWRLKREGLWLHCTPDDVQVPPQGWKIHLSATQEHALAVLQATCGLLLATRTAFKVVLDRALLSMLNGKGWPRGHSGKFITIYPVDTDQFVRIIRELDDLTSDCDGPYILSDKRYRTSRVVHYRYGGMRPLGHISPEGYRESRLALPDGGFVADERQPYFVLPAGVTDPFPDASSEDGDGLTLGGGRYVVSAALAIRNAGGVYLATDSTTGMEVVIKEARPGVSVGRECVTDLLKKQFRLLQAVESLRIAPRPLALFQDWEHWYLVQERIDGMTLGRLSAIENPLTAGRADVATLEAFWRRTGSLFGRIARALAAMHAAGITIGDLSIANILVSPQTLDITLIDLEAAHQAGVDMATTLVTPQYAAPEVLGGGATTMDSDRFAFGAMLLGYVWPTLALKTLKPSLPDELLAQLLTDSAMPWRLCDLVRALMSAAPAARPGWAEVVDGLELVATVTLRPRVLAEVRANWSFDDVERTCNGIERAATPERVDRLFPADYRLFATNQINLAHGAAGVIHALRLIRGKAPVWAIDWLERRATETDQRCPPGLFSGLAGVSWTLRECGRDALARRLLDRANLATDTLDCVNLHDGLAGIGLANLADFLATGSEPSLQRALSIGERIVSLARRDQSGCYWTWRDELPYGLMYGAAGVSLFLLRLGQTTRDETWIQSGVQALRFELSRASHSPAGGLSWTRSASEVSIVYPYWAVGSAGVGVVIVRYFELMAEPWLRDALDRIVTDLDRKYAVYPGLFNGISGIGHALLDIQTRMKCDRVEAAIRRVASGLKHLAIDDGDDLAWPGDRLLRKSCDLGTGGAGVALFLARYLRLVHESPFDVRVPVN